MTLTANWQQHLSNWQSSGMTQAAYCREHRLNVKTFAARLHDYKRQNETAKFVPVQVQAPVSGTETLVLHAGNRLRLELPSTTSASWLAELLRCLA